VVRRGDVHIVAMSGDFGKPRPAVVIQQDKTSDIINSVTICLVTSDLVEESRVRVDVAPSVENGLQKQSQVQVDKIQTVKADRLRAPVGRLDEQSMRALDLALALHLSLFAPSI